LRFRQAPGRSRRLGERVFLQQASSCIAERQALAAAVPRIDPLLHQALAFEGPQGLRHRTLGQPQVGGERRRRPGEAIGAVEVAQGLPLYGQQPRGVCIRAQQTTDAFDESRDVLGAVSGHHPV